MKRSVLYFGFIFLLTACAVKPKVIPIKKTITVFYTKDLALDKIAKITTLIKQAKIKNSCLLVINGNIFREEPITTLWRGEAEISILNSASVDAIVLCPDFFRFGMKRAQELIQQGNFFFLGANLKTSNPMQNFAHEYLIKDLAKTKIGLIGISFDTTEFYLTDIKWENPIWTIKRLIPMLRLRSDLVGLVTVRSDSVAISDLDFVIGAINPKGISAPNPVKDEILCRLDLFLSPNNQIVEYRSSSVSVSDTISEDSLVQATIQHYAARTDSILNCSIIALKNDLTIEDFSHIISQAVFAQTNADVLILPKQFVTKPIPKGPLTYRTLFAGGRLNQPLLITELNGKAIGEMKQLKSEVIISPRLKKSKLLPNLNYRVAFPRDLWTSISLTGKTFAPTDSSLVSMIANYLKKKR